MLYFSYSVRVSQAVQGLEGKKATRVYVGQMGSQVFQGFLEKLAKLEYQEVQVFIYKNLILLIQNSQKYF